MRGGEEGQGGGGTRQLREKGKKYQTRGERGRNTRQGEGGGKKLQTRRGKAEGIPDKGREGERITDN